MLHGTTGKSGPCLCPEKCLRFLGDASHNCSLLPLNFVLISQGPPIRPFVLPISTVHSKVNRTSHLKRSLKTTYKNKQQI